MNKSKKIKKAIKHTYMPCSFLEVRSKIFVSKKVLPIKLTIYTNKLNNKIKTIN